MAAAIAPPPTWRALDVDVDEANVYQARENLAMKSNNCTIHQFLPRA